MEAFSWLLSFSAWASCRSTDISRQKTSFVSDHWSFFNVAGLAHLSSIMASKVCSPWMIPYHTFLDLTLSTISFSVRPLDWKYLASSLCTVAVIWFMSALLSLSLSSAVLDMFLKRSTPPRMTFLTQVSRTQASESTVTWTAPAKVFMKLHHSLQTLCWYGGFLADLAWWNWDLSDRAKCSNQDHKRLQKTAELRLNSQKDC